MKKPKISDNVEPMWGYKQVRHQKRLWQIFKEILEVIDLLLIEMS